MGITTELNERLTRVGPGTSMGNLLRAYWQPILPAAKLDEDPVHKVRILGEDLVLYRDRSGDMGLISSTCAHRSVDLKFGIPEAHGLRCPYHGWYYDKTGQCVETPLEASTNRMKENIKLAGYPVEELGGLVWAYMGPLPAPILPRWDYLVWPNAIRQIAVVELECNWLRCQEHSVGLDHAKDLHRDFLQSQLDKMGLPNDPLSDNSASRLDSSTRPNKGAVAIVIDRDKYGLRKGVRFSKEAGAAQDFTCWNRYMVFPNAMLMRGSGGLSSAANFLIAVDDTHTLQMLYRSYSAPEVEAPKQDVVPYFMVPDDHEGGEPILDYGSGPDWMAPSSQGEMTEGTREHFGASDLGVIEYRNLLEEQIQLVEQNKEPTINVFRDPAEVGDMIVLDPPLDSGSEIDALRSVR